MATKTASVVRRPELYRHLAHAVWQPGLPQRDGLCDVPRRVWLRRQRRRRRPQRRGPGSFHGSFVARRRRLTSSRSGAANKRCIRLAKVRRPLKRAASISELMPRCLLSRPPRCSVASPLRHGLTYMKTVARRVRSSRSPSRTSFCIRLAMDARPRARFWRDSNLSACTRRVSRE